MADAERTGQAGYIRCNSCSRVVDNAGATHCPICGSLIVPSSREDAAVAAMGISVNAGPVPRSAHRWAVACGLGGMALAVLALWYFGFVEWRRPSPQNTGEVVVVSPQRQERGAGVRMEERPLSLKPGEAFRECDGCPEMVVVPAGSFIMGSTEGEYGHSSEEQPQHVVSVPKNLAVAKFEVTARQFVDFLNASVQEGRFAERWIGTAPESANASVIRTTEGGVVRFSTKADHEDEPVTFVSWNAAVEYSAWLSRRAGTPYRLLSEAEWEYAARAGSKTAYHFGDDVMQICEYGNVADLSGQEKNRWSQVVNCDDGYADLAPVGKFRPNAFGLHDMIGNAAEWVQDCWHRTYDGAPSDGAAWIIKGDCSSRVVRGGSYNYLSTGLRSAQRYANSALTRIGPIGFRVARSIP